MTFATFFLSSGRCGTQWLAMNLKAVYGDCAVVEHEPILRKYMPKKLLGTGDPAKSDYAQVIFDHVAGIEHHLESTSYIECGWPCYGALRYFAAKFAGRMRIVHLTRHPVPTAISMLPHGYYATTTILDTWALLAPTDPGVAFPEYADRWGSMTRLEKCLYFWAEINSLGLVLERELKLPWLRIKSEDMFQADGLDRLLGFLELPRRDAIYAARSQPYDKWAHFTTEEPPDLAVIERHPKVMDVAMMLGYQPAATDTDSIGDRYKKKIRQPAANPRSR